MKPSRILALAALAVAAPAAAADRFAERMDSCLTQLVISRQAATVVLECTAQAGKLANCRAVENSATGRGFDRAAVCIAEVMPIGARTGVIRVPMRFPRPA